VDDWFERRLRGRAWADLLMYGASAAGEHSLVWLAWALFQGQRGPGGLRSLARAGAALGIESAIVNGVVKGLIRRQRPPSEGPHPLPLRTPRSSSFPSGHASAAFLAAALLRDGARWPALPYLAASVVAASRVHVRMHHASDVLAGAAIGAALGELARALVPLSGPCRGRGKAAGTTKAGTTKAVPNV
jgi:undecaprenyl-diphosphatase